MCNLPLIVVNSSKTSKLFTWTSTISVVFIFSSSLYGISWSLISSVVFPAPAQPTMIPLVWQIFICPFLRNSLNSWRLIVAVPTKFVFVTIFCSFFQTLIKAFHAKLKENTNFYRLPVTCRHFVKFEISIVLYKYLFFFFCVCT